MPAWLCWGWRRGGECTPLICDILPPAVSGPQEEQQRLAEQRLQEEQEKKAKEAAAASNSLNVTVDVQVSPGRQGGEGPLSLMILFPGAGGTG